MFVWPLCVALGLFPKSAFTLKRVQEVLQIFMFEAYLMDDFMIETLEEQCLTQAVCCSSVIMEVEMKSQKFCSRIQ